MPLIAAGAMMLGNYFAGQNAMNAGLQANRDNLGFSQADIAWQTRMANTAHQREINDLREAGLNPVLSATNGGAATPAGTGSAGQIPVPQIQSPDVFKVMDLANTATQLDQQQQKINLDKANSAAQIAKNMSDTDVNNMQKQLMQKGLPWAMVEGKGAQWLQKVFDMLDKSSTPPPRRKVPDLRILNQLHQNTGMEGLP